MAQPDYCSAVIQNFDQLPDDALVSPGVTALLLGGLSMRTLRRSPPIPKVRISTQRVAYRVGDIRKLVRGALPAA
jgi:hypothetical protein